MSEPNKAHRYQSCSDTHCPRPYCQIWREARDEGYEDAKADFYQPRYDEGYRDGEAAGYKAGHADGWTEGYSAGRAAGCSH